MKAEMRTQSKVRSKGGEKKDHPYGRAQEGKKGGKACHQDGGGGVRPRKAGGLVERRGKK